MNIYYIWTLVFWGSLGYNKLICTLTITLGSVWLSSIKLFLEIHKEKVNKWLWK